MTKKNIYIVFNKKISSEFLKNIRIDKFYNEISYDRMEQALFQLHKTNRQHNILLKGENHINNDVSHINFKELNEKQNLTIKMAASAKNFFLLHGPPGTGKTITLSYLAKYETEQRNKKILVAADSNTAVDVFSRDLINLNTDFVRIGQSVKIDKKIIPHTLNERIKNNHFFKEAILLEKKIGDMENEMKNFKNANMANRRGYSFEQILSFHKNNKTGRGLSSNDISQMAQWIKIKFELDRLYRKYKILKEKAIAEILQTSKIIVTTNSAAGSEIMKDMFFDYVIIDEATQATEPSSIIPFIKGKKVILAGDHKQLPPTILSYKAAKEGFSKSLFERLLEFNNGSSIMLDTQYRMNKELNDLVSDLFYNNKLNCEAKIAKQYLQLKEISKEYVDILGENSNPFIYVPIDGQEKHLKNSSSYYNENEAGFIVELLRALKKVNYKKSIGIITGYSDQKKYLKEKLTGIDLDIIVNTVDGFQGGEKDLIIFSLVRSNESNDPGFLKDKRRINVAISRARRKLIIVGHRKIYQKIF
ncbi:IGHMBP2 family helicase [bacterium]|nr:IGHMBP2 family helicase [bacterium]